MQKITVRRVIAITCFAGLAVGLRSPAIADESTQSPAPAGVMTARFTTFLSDILAGRVPSQISPTMKADSSTLIAKVQSALKPLGTFKKLEFVSQDTMQGYHQYHYTAVFAKGVQPVMFVTDASGTIAGFFEDQPPAKAGPPPADALTATFTAFLTDILAGRMPYAKMSEAMRTGMTPSLMSQIRGSLSALGTFERLRFVSHETVQGYQRYHYSASFDQGSEPLLFVTDSTGAIAGFFDDKPR
jgi:hypothetical protein